ncbi:HDOD domain-containing protein [Vibrio sp. THAF190c]|uniref:HDOD domain-containing protein n=1 Tax=Vibrio sp. THAF190c TaxID=2587865 RepID=UPI0012680D66|nr:HDOD domain-containing protein [Vibrio sp. THAF190c]QFT11820.1 HDOD domain protein [Vibrio sp. THAF190c]
MFKRVLQTLFPSLKGQPSKTSQESANNVESQSQLQQSEVAQTATSQHTLRADKPLSPHDADFLNYLFGESRLNTESDPFSDFVAARIEKLLLSPKALLNELPVMPASITTLMSELKSEDFNVETLLKVIDKEPSMAADMIKLANSARYRRSEKEVTDLKTAFMNMGSQGLIEGVINAYLKEFSPTLNIYWRQFGEKIWDHSLQTACYSRELLKDSTSKEDESTAYFVGLIRNLGKMIIFQVMLEAFRHVDPSVPPNSTAFKRLINSYSIKLTYTLAKFWELPESVLLAIAYQESQKFSATPLAIAVLEANYLSELQSLLRSEIIDLETFEKRSEQRLTQPKSLAIVETIRAEAAELNVE